MSSSPPATQADLWALAAWLYACFTQLDGRITTLMAAVKVEQTDLDNLAAQLEAAKSAIQAEIETLQAQVDAGNLPAGSLDGLNQALTDLQSLEPPTAQP